MAHAALLAFEVEMSAISTARTVSPLRSRTQSWGNLPQGHRGITLGELKEFYNSNKEWIEEKRWRCSACKQCSQDGEAGGGPCKLCGHAEGALQSRNLYEVNEVMIKPRCEEERISYVELLARHSRVGSGHMPVQTFVSHWWGEEFTKFVASLERFAQLRQRSHEGGWMPTLIGMAVFGLILPPCILYFMTGWSVADMQQFRWDPLRVTKAANIDFLLRGCLLVARVVARLTLEEPVREMSGNYSFWICAFCNNQYALDHALGVQGDVSTTSFAQALHAQTCQDVVAVFDSTGELYNRVWCIFEFFMVKELLPKKFGRFLGIFMANEEGVFSEGDATADAVKDVRSAILKINTAEAQASVPRDKEQIEEYLSSLGCTHANLDKMLRQIGREGLQAAVMRRALPLMTFAMGPAMGTLFTEWVHSTYNWSRPEHPVVRLYLPYLIARPPSRWASVACLLLGSACIWCVEVIVMANVAQRLKDTYRTRVFLGSFLMAFPGIFYSMLQAVVFASMPRESWVVYFVACSRNICAVCQIYVAIAGLLLGLLYVALRDRKDFSATRQWIEDTFFAMTHKSATDDTGCSEH